MSTETMIISETYLKLLSANDKNQTQITFILIIQNLIKNLLSSNCMTIKERTV